MDRKIFMEIDNSEQASKYIDELCSDPDFLCKPNHRQLCGDKTTIYSNVSDVDRICKDITKANECEYDFQECVVLAENKFDNSKQYISTSFENIIVPIPKAVDQDGNQKFIRLPKLLSSKKPNSLETCSVCACMNRFATSPGASRGDPTTAPGQNSCMYLDTFEYYYYPLNIQGINTQYKDAPNVKMNDYIIINSNIIPVVSEQGLSAPNLFFLLIENGISKTLATNFITKTLYPSNKYIANQLKAVV
jgi:hypothetical protein